MLEIYRSSIDKDIRQSRRVRDGGKAVWGVGYEAFLMIIRESARRTRCCRDRLTDRITSPRVAEHCFCNWCLRSMTCGCVLIATLGLTLPLLDSVPRTIQFEQFEWDTVNPLQTYSTSGVIATSSDGSWMNWVQFTSRMFHLFVTEKALGHSIYLRAIHTAYLIDHEKRTAWVVPCVCEWQHTKSTENPQCDRREKIRRGSNIQGIR
jgi:hypothetical protein